MYVGFQHPDYGIPCIGVWDQFDHDLIFFVENEGEAKQYNLHEALKQVKKWCNEASRTGLETIEQVNSYLGTLGISERLQE